MCLARWKILTRPKSRGLEVTGFTLDLVQDVDLLVARLGRIQVDG